jgi:outer membrane protein OmpA-like peptidoglycan-associated protein
MRAEKAAAEAEAARKAEAAALESAAKSASERAASSAQQAALMEAKARDLEAQRQALLADQATLEAERQALIVDRDRIKSERDALAETLATALATVAAVRETAAGTIVDLPGILFDTGKATLKPGAQITIAKLSGILMMFPLSTLDIRGHTDSTGSMELNMRLSKERAQAVYDFLASQGLPKERMKFDGSGPNEPIASNDTADGRAKNRRVEVLIIEGGALEAGAAN